MPVLSITMGRMNPRPHRKRLRRFELPCCLHELTFSCYLRKPLLTNDPWRRILAESLQAACDAERFDLIAFVFMPEHVHLLVSPTHPTSVVSRLLALTKQPASKAIKHLLVASGSKLLDDLTVRERPGKYCFRFWQEGAGFDRNLFSARAIAASIDYLHANPVRRGLCQKATDWKWSSARFYIDGSIDADLPKIARPDPSWFDTSGAQSEHA